MIAAYGHHGMGSEALQLFNKMLAANCKVDSITFINLLNSCSHSGMVDDALQ